MEKCKYGNDKVEVKVKMSKMAELQQKIESKKKDKAAAENFISSTRPLNEVMMGQPTGDENA